MEILQTAAPVLQWEMYGPGSAVEFSALRNDEGYGLIVRRDHELLVSCAVSDVSGMLLKSSHLRERLQQLGFAAMPLGDYESQLGGGVSWGPAAPLDSSVVEAFM
jgi:hypothetical protein